MGGVSAVAVAGVLMLGVEALSGGRAAGAVSGGVASAGSVVARPGDTLWSIAGEHRGPVSIGRYVDALVDLNGGAAIQAGQTVRLP